ncbi:MAG: RNase adapter RapZ [Gammaproteobacteria bacterium]|nr:RNase adapter RapZ [Gammaproteobacteria bacterium]
MSLVIISGRSGSGKSTALHVLEDLGYYCIDNLPASLLLPLLNNLGRENNIDRISVSIDARNLPSELREFNSILETVDKETVTCKVIYLDSMSATLVKRFSETRRKHPLSNSKTNLKTAIDREQDLLEPIAERADLKLDTTNLTIHELRDIIRDRIGDSKRDFSLMFESFGFKKGVPVDADMVFDTRCLPNPHWKPELRNLTGKDESVINFLDSDPDAEKMYNDILAYLDYWLPKFKSGNRSYMTVAIGCTGGQHRSVYMCEKLYKHYSEKWPNVQILHKELGVSY